MTSPCDPKRDKEIGRLTAVVFSGPRDQEDKSRYLEEESRFRELCIESGHNQRVREQITVRLYKLSKNNLLRLAYKILKDESLAEDAFSRALYKVIKALPRLGKSQEELHLGGYLVTVVKNEALNLARRRKSSESVVPHKSLQIYPHVKEEMDLDAKLDAKREVNWIIRLVEKVAPKKLKEYFNALREVQSENPNTTATELEEGGEGQDLLLAGQDGSTDETANQLLTADQEEDEAEAKRRKEAEKKLRSRLKKLVNKYRRPI